MIDIKEIIPPNNHEHREGFNNVPIIDKLTDGEKRLVEDVLINMLLTTKGQGVDTLITETLAYLKSEKSIPVLMNAVNDCTYEMCRLSIFSSIFEINGDDRMIDLAISSFRKFESGNNKYHIYDLIPAFYYLSKFNRTQTNRILEDYTTHKEYLVSYNAKQALGIL